MQSKKPQAQIFIVLGVLILIGLGIGAVIYFVNFPGQSIIRVESVSYECPESFVCEVQPTLDCTIPTEVGAEEVLFRYEGSYGRETQFALSLFGGSLQSYEYDDQISSSNCGTDKSSYLFSKGGEIHHSGNHGVFVCYLSSGSQKARTYKVGGNADIDPTPKDPNLEIVTGVDDRFNCPSKSVLLNTDELYTLSWQDDNPTPDGGLLGQTVFMSGGDLLEYNGQINILKEEFQAERITTCLLSNGEEVNIGEQMCVDDDTLEKCILPEGTEVPIIDRENAIGRMICTNGLIQCANEDCVHSANGIGQILDDGTGYYTCKIDSQGCQYVDTSDIIFCAENELFDETELVCKPPYSLSLSLDKVNLGTSDLITGEIIISDTDQRNQIPIRVDIKKDGNPTIVPINYLTNNFGRVTIAISPITQIGDYIISAEAFHPDGTQSKQIPVSVVSQIRTEISLPLGKDFTQFDNEPVKIIATSLSGSQIEGVREWVINANLEGAVISQSKINIQPISGTGKVEISLDVKGEGNLDIEVYAIDESGFQTDTEKITITLKRATLLIPIDISEANNQETGNHRVSFQTLSSGSQLVNTNGNNQVSITLPNTCKSGEFCTQSNKAIPGVNVQGTNGQYSFTFNFDDSGLYLVDISSFTEGFEVSQAIPTSINIRGKTVTNGDSNTKWILIGVGVLALIMVVVFVAWKLNKRR